MKESFNDPILDMAVENQLRWNYNTFFRDCRIEPKIDTFRVYGPNIEFDYVYLNAEKSNLLDLKDEAASDKTIGEYYLLEALRHTGVDREFWDQETILYQDVFAASTRERIRPTYLSYAEDEDWLCNTWAYKLEEATNEWFRRLLGSQLLPRLSNWRITIRDLITDLEPKLNILPKPKDEAFNEDPGWRGMSGIFEPTKNLLCVMFNHDLEIFYDMLEKVFPSPYEFMTIKERDLVPYLTEYMANNPAIENLKDQCKDRFRAERLPTAIVDYMELYRPLYQDLYVYIQHRMKTRSMRNGLELSKDLYRLIDEILKKDESAQILSFRIDAHGSDGATEDGKVSEESVRRIHELIESRDPAFLNSTTYLDDAKCIVLYKREDKNHE